ncbi:DUF1127 domain-containing protein [Salinarimonas sp.]|uniref:DUF1127 domain-containing protein n=1 Tax=Salinarimonas sp. TaxID=2766526 RepID=UPI0032D96CA3
MVDMPHIPAAGPAPASTALATRVLHALASWIRRAAAAAARRRRIAEARAALEAMNDGMLADIGLTRGDIPFRVTGGDPDGIRR